MAAVAADRELLFGLLALQNGLINQAQLLAAFQAWTLERSKSLAEHLVALGHLSPARRPVVEAMAALHLEAHGGDVGKSLAAVPASPATRAGLASIKEPQIEATLARVGRAEAANGRGHRGGRPRRPRPHRRPLRGLGHLRRPAVPRSCGRTPAAGWARCSSPWMPSCTARWRSSRSSRSTPTTRTAASGSSPRRRSPAGWSTRASCRSTAWARYGDGRPYYAMRFIRGDSLKEAIEHFHGDPALKGDPGRRSLELRKLLRRFVDVCNAIDYAHSRGVIHRDIKPANIILGKHGETLVVDWGLAKAVGRADPSIGEQTIAPSSSGSSETLPGSALGTPAYMSPEQAGGDLDRLGPRSDVYSLGATLYCLLTGRPPLEGEDIGEVLRKVQAGDFRAPRQVDPSLDRALEAVCLKAMAHRPEDRYATPRALAEDVERWMADEPVSAWREPLSRRARRWARRNRPAVTAAAAAPGRGDRAVGGAGRAGAGQRRHRPGLRRETSANAALAAANEELGRSRAAVQARYELAGAQPVHDRGDDHQRPAD